MKFFYVLLAALVAVANARSPADLELIQEGTPADVMNEDPAVESKEAAIAADAPAAAAPAAAAAPKAAPKEEAAAAPAAAAAAAPAAAAPAAADAPKAADAPSTASDVHDPKAAVAAPFWAKHPADDKLVPLFRYYNSALRDHFYTLEYNTLENGKNGWVYQGIQAYVYPTQEKDTVPVYKYFNLRLGDDRLESDFYVLGEGKEGYKYKGIAFYAFAQPHNGTVPLLKFFNQEIGDSFVTTNQMTQARGDVSWANQGTLAYVFNVPHPIAKPEDKTTAHGNSILIPIYRYWNSKFQDHMMTTEFQKVGNGDPVHSWTYQGVVGLCFSQHSSADNTVPMYRYWNIRTLDHFYTTNFNALGKGGKDGWKYEGIECHVSTYSTADNVPLYRYFSASYNDHFYTTEWLGRAPKQAGEYVYEGVQAYIGRKPLDGLQAGGVQAPKGMQAVYQSYSPSDRNHRLSTNVQATGDGYGMEGVAFFGFEDQSTGGVALHSYWNDRIRDSFYTTSFSLLGAGGKDGWKYEGILTFVQTRKIDSLVPLLRVYNKDASDHAYVTEFEGTEKHGYVLQGTAGYVAPPPKALAISATDKAGNKLGAPGADAEEAVLYAYTNAAKNNDQFVTTDYSKLGAGKSGWAFNERIGKVFLTSKTGTVKLRQYFTKGVGHRYATRAIGGSAQFEGIVGYIYADHQPATKPLLAFKDPNTGATAIQTSHTAPKNMVFVETLGFVAQ